MKKNYVFIVVLLWLGLAACDSTPTKTSSIAPQLIQGETMGTYYRVTFRAENEAITQRELDSLLVALNMEVSTYIPEALISRFNYGDLRAIDAETLQAATHFKANLELALAMAQQTNNYFNPTVMPLVNYWGFGYTPKKPVTAVDSMAIDSLMQFVGLDKIEYDPVIVAPSAIQLDKESQGTQLDFSAIAKGYGVDLLAEHLESRGIKHYLVDIGGEVVAKGVKDDEGTSWRIGIAIPREEAAPTDMQVAVPLRDAAIATSGNYRNFYEINGQKFSHTINPFTGYPERSQLLSASILAADCATADGLATACMVAGLDKAYEMIDGMPGVEGYFIYGDEAGALQVKKTKGFAALLEEAAQ